MNLNVLFKVITLAKRLHETTDHHITVDYCPNRDEVEVFLYRHGKREAGLETFSTMDYSLESIYATLMDLIYEFAGNDAGRLAEA